MPDFSIRDATDADLPALAEAMVRLQTAHTEAFPDVYRTFDVDVAKGHLESQLNEPDTVIRVATVSEDGQSEIIAGHVVFAVEEKPETVFTRARRIGHLCQIEVEPAFRRSGLGQLLLEDCDRLATAHGVTQIFLQVGAFNSPARAFFEESGFEEFGSRLCRRVRIER
ncbi:MAG: GNAT family N-acetyltransferase [Verrucomicrobiales bacterium]|nr:GNAT family N-acetyltransferase [Verrucomicrobiales bacterium]